MGIKRIEKNNDKSIDDMVGEGYYHIEDMGDYFVLTITDKGKQRNFELTCECGKIKMEEYS